MEASPHNQNGQKRKHGGGDPHPTTPLYLVLKTHEGANWAQVASAKWGGDYFQNLSIQLVFAGPVQSGFLPPKRATVDRNQSRTNPDIEGTEPNHLGPVFCGPWCRFRPV